jgi:hypothetical protein
VPRLRNFMIRVRGGEPLPDAVTFPLERGERVLTWARVAHGGIAAATDVGLRVRPGEGDLTLHQWHEIAHATWGDGQLHIVDATGAARSYQLTEPRGVPAAVREHVNATVVLSERHLIDLDSEEQAQGVRVVARRNLRSGRLVWSTVFDQGVDAGEQLQARADELLNAVRRRFAGDG